MDNNPAPKPSEADSQPAEPSETPKASSASNGGVMDVVAPPPAEKPADTGASASNAETPSGDSVPAKPVTKPVTPKQPHAPNVTLAILATIVIVLGVAALATVAYLQKK